MAHPKRRQSKTRTAKNGMFITQYVGLVVITEVNWLSKKKLLFNNLTLCRTSLHVPGKLKPESHFGSSAVFL